MEVDDSRTRSDAVTTHDCNHGVQSLRHAVNWSPGQLVTLTTGRTPVAPKPQIKNMAKTTLMRLPSHVL